MKEMDIGPPYTRQAPVKTVLLCYHQTFQNEMNLKYDNIFRQTNGSLAIEFSFIEACPNNNPLSAVTFLWTT